MATNSQLLGAFGAWAAACFAELVEAVVQHDRALSEYAAAERDLMSLHRAMQTGAEDDPLPDGAIRRRRVAATNAELHRATGVRRRAERQYEAALARLRMMETRASFDGFHEAQCGGAAANNNNNNKRGQQATAGGGAAGAGGEQRERRPYAGTTTHEANKRQKTGRTDGDDDDDGTVAGEEEPSDAAPPKDSDNNNSQTGVKGGTSWDELVKTWEKEVMNASGQQASLARFPDPPFKPCGRQACAAESRALKACCCNIGEMLRQSDRNTLKAVRIFFHPDKFSACDAGVKQESQKKACEIFVVADHMYKSG